MESLIEVSTCKTLRTRVAYRVDILMDGWRQQEVDIRYQASGSSWIGAGPLLGIGDGRW